jgi:hypothetical protein
VRSNAKIAARILELAMGRLDLIRSLMEISLPPEMIARHLAGDWGGHFFPNGKVINGSKQRVQERTNSVEFAQRRHLPEEDECGSCDGGERLRGWIRIIYGRDSAARWCDHFKHRQGGCRIGRRGMMITEAGWIHRTQ